MTDADTPLVEYFPAMRQSLRVSVVTETYPPEVNGVATTIARFVQGLCALGHSVQLVRPRQGSMDRAEQSDGYHEVLRSGVMIPRYSSLRMGLPSYRALKRLWTLHRPDVVHLVTEGPLGWSALRAAAKLGIPMSSDMRTNFHAYSLHYGVGWLRRPIVAYLRKFHNRTAATLVPTESMRRDLSEAGFRNLRVIARGVDATTFAPEWRSPTLRRAWGADDDAPVVLHVGRLAPEKNLGTLAESFDAIRLSTPGARFVVVGDGPERAALQARCPYALFAGQKRGEALAAHYASSDVFVFPSVTETFGNVTLEAMASGLAVVAFDYAAAAEHLRHGVSGLLAPYGNVPAFIELAAGVCRNLELVRGMSTLARVAAESLSWDTVTRNFEEVLLEVAFDNAPTVGSVSPGPRRAVPV